MARCCDFSSGLSFASAQCLHRGVVATLKTTIQASTLNSYELYAYVDTHARCSSASCPAMLSVLLVFILATAMIRYSVHLCYLRCCALVPVDFHSASALLFHLC